MSRNAMGQKKTKKPLDSEAFVLIQRLTKPRETLRAHPVDFLRIFQNRINGNPAIPFQFIEETAFPTGMTGNAANLFDRKQQDVAIAIGPDSLHFLEVARFLALAPKTPS